MAGQATEFSAARRITAAGFHRCVVFQKVRFALARSTDLEDRERVVQPCSGAKIKIVFAGLKDASVAALMAIHADVFRHPGRQSSGVYD